MANLLEFITLLLRLGKMHVVDVVGYGGAFTLNPVRQFWEAEHAIVHFEYEQNSERFLKYFFFLSKMVGGEINCSYFNRVQP